MVKVRAGVKVRNKVKVRTTVRATDKDRIRARVRWNLRISRQFHLRTDFAGRPNSRDQIYLADDNAVVERQKLSLQD